MSHIHLTRLVIETQSPMAINTGGRETGFDAQLARDVNGLPYLPATSIAGVWSHLVANCLSTDIRDKWFGTTAQSSSLTLSNGVIHNSHNKPVSELTPAAELANDPILHLVQQQRPHHRERVSINDRGVATENGKFDQLLLPKGVRFSLTLRWSDQIRHDKNSLNKDEWQQLLSLWQDRRFAFGASTRNGLGQIKVIACQQHSIDLSQGPQAGKLLQQHLNSAAPTRLTLPELSDTNTQLIAELPLQALDNWRCGAGTELLSTTKPEHDVAIITYSESAVEWNNDQAHLAKSKPVLCGSSIKGILAHRVAYHLRKHQAVWAEEMAQHNHEQWQTRPAELDLLFGIASDNHQDSRAGQLYVDDVIISHQHTVIRQHNSIDRFTGGVRKGALYSEELLYQPHFTIKLWLTKDAALSAELKAALADTLNDLKLGLLPMGAGSGRGNSLVLPQPNKNWRTDLSAIAINPHKETVQ